ncbi:M23 family metallopeptidase [Patescibacteria group bacterium]|nr:M23 family metallopeptidase [Patescibacteria group bacterium]
MKKWLMLTVIALIAMAIAGCQTSDNQGTITGAESTLSDSAAGSKNGEAFTDDWGYVNYPINPWLPLGTSNTFGNVTSRGVHLGDDCVRNPGTPICAIYQGTVKYKGYHGGTGNWGYIMIVESMINNLPFCTVYGHLGSNMPPSQGNWVTTDQCLGTVGSTQQSGQTTPHLHLGIHYGPYGTQTGTYPSWCKGYSSSTNGWFNPTSFIAYR